MNSVLTSAPLRISFLGGGTDFASFYERSSGTVLASAIDKYVYVHIKRHDPLFQERFRVSYSEVEHCQSRMEIKNLIVRASLELLDIDIPLQISTSADLPANSGLGSSSSFAVALLLGLHQLKGERVGAAQLAEEACKVEIDYLKSPIGKQDQYIAAFGGVNFIEFLPDGTVKIEPISHLYSIIDDIFANSSLIWSKKSREANLVLSDQEKRSNSNFNELLNLKALTIELCAELKNPNTQLSTIGRLITKGWEIKKELSPLIVSPEISKLMEEISEFEILGSKLLGAGSGGFVYTLHRNLLIDSEIISKRWPFFSPGPDHEGARVLSAI
jgi:D-glycero-alpha-D-manno-heptose-7-phosphate kinase